MESIHFVLACLILGTVLAIRSQNRRRALPLPPGPRRLPIVGNLFSRPMHEPWLTYLDWGTALNSDLVSTEVFGQTTIVINTPRAADELLWKRSAIYSSRPSQYMLTEVLHWKWDFGFLGYTSWWRRQRKTFHQYFNENEVNAYRAYQKSATITMLRYLLREPDKFVDHIRRYTASIIFFVTCGYEVQVGDDPLVKILYTAMRGSFVDAALPGNFLIDYFPILRFVPRWFPCSSFTEDVENRAKCSLKLLEAPFEVATKEDKAQTTAGFNSFVSASINRSMSVETESEHGTALEIIKNCAAVALTGGAETTSSLVLATIMALVYNPQVQARAHAELDTVVGRNRLPDFSDKEDLPYISAMVLESLRWKPLPLALAHASICDDVYDGYFIPRGSTIIGNAWAILRNEDTYPDAHSYKPERFMGPNPQRDPIKLGAFGFGRRICAGRHFAMNTNFIAVASLLWAFTFAPEKDENGMDIMPDHADYADAIPAFTTAFKCKITPRFEEVESIVGLVN